MNSEFVENDCGDLVKILMNEFSTKGLKFDKNVNFSKWKLNDLRYFLKLSKNYHGFSNLNKEKVLEKVIFVWNKILSSYNLSSNIKLAYNNDLPKIPIPSISLKENPKFEKWTISKLQDYLGDRGINRNGDKQTLVNNALSVFNMNLPITFTNAKEEVDEIQQDVLKKLFIENDLVHLPNPLNLINGWTEAPLNFPDTLLQQINNYLYSNNAGKAFKGGKSLLNSGHLSNVMSHPIGDMIKYCFIRGFCLPEQKLSHVPYDVWIVLHKDSGNVVTGNCSCPAGTSGICKHVGALLWYVEKEVSLGNNHSCTSKKQQWSVPSKKQIRLHAPETLVNIELKKSKKEDYTDSLSEKRFIHSIDNKPLNENDIDLLAEITNGKCGLVTLMRKESTFFNISMVHKEVEISTSVLIDFPKSISEVIQKVGPCSFEILMSNLKITKEQQSLLIAKTISQSSSDIWFQHRKYRITASNFKSAVNKINEGDVIINLEKSKSIISKICGYSKKINSKATSWGISNEPIARKKYLSINRPLHKTFTVKRAGFYTSLLWPFLGASPDGLVSCKCHEPGLLELKCPWTHRGLSIKEFVLQKSVYLEVYQDKFRLKRNHAYYYQVQLQMYVTKFKWCDFFVYMNKDSFCERVYIDDFFMEKAVSKAKIVYEQLIMPEIFFRELYNLTVQDVEDILNGMLNKVCSSHKENVENVYESITNTIQMNEIIDFVIEN